MRHYNRTHHSLCLSLQQGVDHSQEKHIHKQPGGKRKENKPKMRINGRKKLKRWHFPDDEM